MYLLHKVSCLPAPHAISFTATHYSPLPISTAPFQSFLQFWRLKALKNYKWNEAGQQFCLQIKAEKDRKNNVNETRIPHLRFITRWSTAALEDRRKQCAQMCLWLKPIASLLLLLIIQPCTHSWGHQCVPHLTDRHMDHWWCWVSLPLCYSTHQPLPQANIGFSALPTALFTNFLGADT